MVSEDTLNQHSNMATPGQFYFTNPEAAKMSIAELQLQAALAENESRQNIERERTAAAKYATQSQINESEKNRAVQREEISARYGSARGTAAGNIQYRTVLDSMSETDPPTKSELEAMLAANPQLSDDLKNNLRAERDRRYKNAVDNFKVGDQLAKNYRKELDDNAKDQTKLDAIYLRIGKDENVSFDRTTGSVQSRFRMPREDSVSTGTGISPAQDYGGATPSQSTINRPAPAGASTGVTTLEDMRARITGSPSGIGNAEPIAPAPPVTSSDLREPTPSIGSFGIPTMSGIARGIGSAIQSIPINPYGGLELFQQGGSPRIPRGFDMAPPPAYQPPSFAVPTSPFGAVGQQMRATMPNAPTAFEMMPRAITPPSPRQDWDNLQYLWRAYDQSTSPDQQREIMDEIRSLQGLPRMYDLQTIRPEFRPPLQ